MYGKSEGRMSLISWTSEQALLTCVHACNDIFDPSLWTPTEAIIIKTSCLLHDSGYVMEDDIGLPSYMPERRRGIDDRFIKLIVYLGTLPGLMWWCVASFLLYPFGMSCCIEIATSSFSWRVWTSGKPWTHWKPWMFPWENSGRTDPTLKKSSVSRLEGQCPNIPWNGTNKNLPLKRWLLICGKSLKKLSVKLLRPLLSYLKACQKSRWESGSLQKARSSFT